MFEIMKPDFYHEDGRGKLVQLVHSGYNQINVVYSKAGTVRGGHYHRENREAFYVVAGTCKVELTKGDSCETQTFSAGQFFCIEPGTIHTFQYVEDTILVGLYDLGVELAGGETDIVPADK